MRHNAERNIRHGRAARARAPDILMTYVIGIAWQVFCRLRFYVQDCLLHGADHAIMTDMLNVVGVLFLVLVFTSGNVERSLWWVDNGPGCANQQVVPQHCRYPPRSESRACEWPSDRRTNETQTSTRSPGMLDILCEHAM